MTNTCYNVFEDTFDVEPNEEINKEQLLNEIINPEKGMRYTWNEEKIHSLLAKHGFVNDEYSTCKIAQIILVYTWRYVVSCLRLNKVTKYKADSSVAFEKETFQQKENNVHLLAAFKYCSEKGYKHWMETERKFLELYKELLPLVYGQDKWMNVLMEKGMSCLYDETPTLNYEEFAEVKHLVFHDGFISEGKTQEYTTSRWDSTAKRSFSLLDEFDICWREKNIVDEYIPQELILAIHGVHVILNMNIQLYNHSEEIHFLRGPISLTGFMLGNKLAPSTFEKQMQIEDYFTLVAIKSHLKKNVNKLYDLEYIFYNKSKNAIYNENLFAALNNKVYLLENRKREYDVLTDRFVNTFLQFLDHMQKEPLVLLTSCMATKLADYNDMFNLFNDDKCQISICYQF